MKTIYKYEIPAWGGAVTLPSGAKILTVGTQLDGLYLWAEIHTDNPPCVRHFEVFGTCHTMREDMGVDRNYLGTAFMGDFVWHVYERI